jgi:MarR family transcriptional regulator, temperature-dependent positive regulator of motility
MQTTPVLHLLHRAAQVAAAAFAEKSSNITPRQLRVLATLKTLERASQTDIVDATGIDRSTITDLIRRLVKKGLIGCQRSKADTRANVITLTAKGAAELEALDAAAQAADDKIIGSLPANLRAPFVKALSHIARPLQAAE